MAIVKTIQSGGATVHIDDSCLAGIPREDLAHRWAEVNRIVTKIRQNAAREAAKHKAALQTPAG